MARETRLKLTCRLGPKVFWLRVVEIDRCWYWGTAVVRSCSAGQVRASRVQMQMRRKMQMEKEDADAGCGCGCGMCVGAGRGASIKRGKGSTNFSHVLGRTHARTGTHVYNTSEFGVGDGVCCGGWRPWVNDEQVDR